MYLVFEYPFYLGLLAIIGGLIQLVWSAIKCRWQRLKYGAPAILVGVYLIFGRTFYSRQQVVDHVGPMFNLKRVDLRQTMISDDSTTTIDGTISSKVVEAVWGRFVKVCLHT